MTRFGIACLALIFLAPGCKKNKDKKQPNFARAHQRIRAANSPADYEWPLKRLKEIESSDAKADVKAAASFELARGWLQLGVLSGVPRDAAEAGRVLTSTGLKDPEGDIAKRFDGIGADVEIGGAPLGPWAKDGARLTRAFLEDDEATISELALADSAFKSEAAAIVFTWMLKAGDASDKRALRKVVSFACPKAAKQLEADQVDLAKFGADCGQATWMATPAESPPCPNLQPNNAAQKAVATYFQKLLQEFGKGSPAGPVPKAFETRFPVNGGCTMVGTLLTRLADLPPP